MKRIEQNGIYVCCKCKKRIYTLRRCDDYVDEKTGKHTKSPDYVCEKCARIFGAGRPDIGGSSFFAFERIKEKGHKEYKV